MSSTTSTPPAVAPFLRPPRLPKVSPVVVVHFRAGHDPSGNPRRCFAIYNTHGRLVEVVDEGYGGESEVWARYPWYQHTAAARLGIRPSYAIGVDVAASEYRRMLRAGRAIVEEGPDAMPDVLRLRRQATRCAKWSALREALTSIRRSSATHEMRERRAAAEGRPNHYAESRGQVVYHRHPDDGGDEVSEWLRRAMVALLRAEMVDRIDTPAEGGNARPFFRRSVGHYVTTDTTPDLY